MTYAWETAQASYAWATGLFPRTVEVHRSKTVAVASGGAQQIGYVGYSGREESTNPSDLEGETILYTNIPANIEALAIGRTRGGILPGDAAEKPQWRILIPGASLAQSSIRDRDIVLDDEFCRYIVVQAWFTTLGYQLSCIKLEA